MKKYVKSIVILFSFLIIDIRAMQPQETAPKLSKFVISTRSLMGGLSESRRMIDEGTLITPEELNQLLNVGPGQEGRNNLEFWTFNGTYFLMFATVRPAVFEPKPLKDLAAKKIDKKSRGRNIPISNDLRSIILGNADISVISEEINKIFVQAANTIEKTKEGDESTQKVKIRDELRSRAIKQLDDLWRDVLKVRPTGFSVIVLKYMVDALWDYKHLISNEQKKQILTRYVNEWIEKRCEELLQITTYLRTHNVIPEIIAQTAARHRDIAGAGFAMATRRDMDLHSDFVSLLRATPQTCPAVVSPLLLQRLGDRAKIILEGKR